VDTSSRFNISNDNLVAISECDLFISVVNTESPNLAFEAGFAYALNKNMILIKNTGYTMPDMFYGITTHSKTIEVKDLANLGNYSEELVSRIKDF